MSKSKAARRGATVTSEKQSKVVVGNKHSELFGCDIEVYGDSASLDNQELSPYNITADLGLDLVAQINDGHTIKPNY